MASMFEADTSGFTERRDPSLEPGEIVQDEDEGEQQA